MSSPDSAQLLLEYGARLDAVHSEPELKLALQIEMVDLADRGARELLAGLEARYFASGNQAESEEQTRSWGQVSLYCAQLEAAYVHLVRQFQTYSQGWAEVGDKIPMVVARSMRATTMRLKWQLLRYLLIEKDIWQTLAQLWAFVEDKGMERARVVVYEDQSTLAREFLKPMILAVSAADSLPAVEVDIACRFIDHLSDKFELQRHPTKTCNYSVDIYRWTLPERYTPVSQVRPGSRFFGAGRIKGQIDDLVSRLAGGEIVPREMNLEGVNDIGAVIHVLEHLSQQWWGRRPERRAERRRSLSAIGVEHGFDNIMARLSSDEVAEQMAPAAETWSVENESDGGYGALLPMNQGDWLHVGKVLAVKPTDTRVWAVGIVRRLAAQEGGQRNVGIEILARGARAVKLHQRTDVAKTWKALLLSSQTGGDASLAEASLLLPAGSFLPDASLEMEVYGTSYILAPRMLLEHGTEFEIARYRIVQRVA